MIDDECPPAWSLLKPASIVALVSHSKGGMPEALSIRPGLIPADTAIVSTTRLMIERAVNEGGLTLTATGALSRADTRAVFDAMIWPGYDKAQALAMNKVLNEADVMPVEATRMIGQMAKLFRNRQRRLHATPLARRLLSLDQSLDLFALLFETAFWRANLGYFDKVPVDAWPQNHVGLVLWCLSVAAPEWITVEPLVPLCTVYDDGFADRPHDFPKFAFESRVLRPLTWFGLIERRLVGEDSAPEWRKERQYRKSPLFDVALRFDVQLFQTSGLAH